MSWHPPSAARSRGLPGASPLDFERLHHPFKQINVLLP
jgi:hypothetical protein